VERNVELSFGADGLAVHRHLVVAGVHFGAELSDDLAVDGDPAVEDEPFAGAPRSHARVGQKFLEPDVQSR